MTGAQKPVTFNDIDPAALKAVAVNAKANQMDPNLDITLDTTDLLHDIERYIINSQLSSSLLCAT